MRRIASTAALGIILSLLIVISHGVIFEDKIQNIQPSSSPSSVYYKQLSNNFQVGISNHKISSSELNALRSEIGVYINGQNYSEVIDGHGTGLQPPTEQEWTIIANNIDSVDSISLDASLPSSVDQSETPWFPPIGNQGPQGSCVAWSIGYYMKTFQEAKEHNWNISAASWQGEPSLTYQNEIMSPAFVYNLLNGGVDSGLNPYKAINLVCSVGISSWQEMPYNQRDYWTWPTKDAWSEASWYRGH